MMCLATLQGGKTCTHLSTTARPAYGQIVVTIRSFWTADTQSMDVGNLILAIPAPCVSASVALFMEDASSTWQSRKSLGNLSAFYTISWAHSCACDSQELPPKACRVLRILDPLKCEGIAEEASKDSRGCLYTFLCGSRGIAQGF